MSSTPGPVDPQTLRLFYSQRDLQFALSAFNFLLEVDEAQAYGVVELRRFRCFLDAGVIAYARPFTQTKGVPLLSFKQIGVKATRGQATLHGDLMNYRHKVVAHSDLDRMRTRVASFAPIEDRPDIRMPVMRTDESLPFLARRQDLIEWLHVLIAALATKTFAFAQTSDGFGFLQEHLAAES